MNKWVRGFLQLVYPRRCCYCRRVIRPDRTACTACAEKIPVMYPPLCDICGRSEDRCTCRKKPRAFARCVTPLVYEGIAHRAIGWLKNEGDVSAVESMAEEMTEVIRREYGGIPFDVIIPVPLYPADEKARSFNPAMLLAEELSRRMGIPAAPLLRKVQKTTPQKELTAARRAGNLLGAFDAAPEVFGRICLLVDDVITTGATLDECAKMLKIAGAREVYAVTAAGAVLKKDSKEAKDG